ncbi:dCMP deaminase family protein [Clostridium sp. Ade.TY]|uniref:deoxycytidylate deaminase n=1 Tax=Clostridium sp. Ade.TY TaxID=1391647 RepID=UPI00040546CC|nr:dCMP deaminase family protein [Clostridium sp. Ade.TY]
MKRNDYISWDEYFMGLALLSAKRSKDPSTQVGACIVSPTNRVLSVGYNGFAFGCSDDDFSWDREGNFLETKYPYVVHAELNAILNNRGVSFENAKLYVALFPCNECAKAIIQSGIKEVIFLSDKYSNTDIVKASKRMFNAAKVKLTQLKPSVEKIELSFKVDDI